MANWDYTNTVPATNNSPAEDQPNMRINTQSNKSIWEVDHVGFGVANGGSHTKVNIITPATPAIQTGSQSTIYTQVGVQNTSAANAAIRNSAGIFPISLVKASGSFTDAIGTVSFLSQFNCSTISYSAAGGSNPARFTITLTSGVTTGNEAIILISNAKWIAVSGQIPTFVLQPNYTFAGGVLTISSTGAGITTFTVLQT